ncbi:MAG: DUF1800 family protein [Alphaproteobacteria bacterium]|nr:DUF1800 family protein [Alphaproteobacteria bacterium]
MSMSRATPEAFIAANRFGFGARPNDLADISTDPQGWLEAQLSARYAHSPLLDKMPSTMEIVRNYKSEMGKRKEMRKEAKSDPEGARSMLRDIVKQQMKDYLEQSAARTALAITSDAPFFERIVQFWSNHFTVSVTKRQDMPLVAAYERDAIRPYVMGSFEDILLSTTRHPAMQIYLDNFRSIGPNSTIGKRRHKGLNENLGREVMELHSLGVNGGYTQKDVTEFSKMLTGWTIDAPGRGDGSGFLFVPYMHEPGSKTLLGKTYQAAGENEARAALHVFANHPSTAKYIATKLARHFIADEPPAEAVEELARAFTMSRGDLPSLYKTLIGLQSVWQNPLAKVKTPNDYIISLMRTTGLEVSDVNLAYGFKTLGQVPFTAGDPRGWSDMAKDWISAESLLQRVDLAQMVGRGVYTMHEPMELLEQTVGPVATPETRTAVKRAGSKAEAIALLFSSPEFQRR